MRLKRLLQLKLYLIALIGSETCADFSPLGRFLRLLWRLQSICQFQLGVRFASVIESKLRDWIARKQH